ncbi:MAG: Peptide/nickel transport system permease protein [Acidimicrobiaceae bacterium]|jgi:ABC-type dipeptide/oligopeptide/nickel transport system permease subunit|nr:Peptide/nickel transport system permease protein [Acidimicrobiaceae bacterium]
MSIDLSRPASGDVATRLRFVEAFDAPPTFGLRVRRALRHRSLRTGVILVTVIVGLVLLAPLIASFNPDQTSTFSTFLKPSWTHPFGTDSFGRDLWSRVLYGGRYTIGASVLIVAIGGTIGTALGLIAGYFGGAIGFAIMRVVDLLLAFPGILMALAVAAILGPGLFNGVIAVAIILVPAYARIVEGATVEVRHLPYVDAAVTLGASSWYLLRRHIIPNVRSGIIVLTSSWLGIAALWIAALGFLGLGVQPPTPEWGAILNDGQAYMTIAWWMTVLPGVFLALFVVGVNLIGDGLRDELDATLSRT